MKKTKLPKDYKPYLCTYETQTAIGFINNNFEEQLKNRLELKRVSAPLFVAAKTGLNDDLNGVETPVSFNIPALNREGEVVHSLAKWKRLALHQYDFHIGNGLYTNMNAIRRDEILDNTHSVYVDQWDWERVISREERTLDYLKKVVQDIVDSICETEARVCAKYPNVPLKLSNQVSFITSQELEDLYPTLTPEQREHEYVREHPTTFIMQIGGDLKSGTPHGQRAPDYDDWSLNGDILFWHEALGQALEISSMGIRVDRDAMLKQLETANALHRLNYEFHQKVVDEILPLTIGGGIGQSRMCMLLLGNVHIGEVQVSLWDDETLSEAGEDIKLL
ncbi:asparagine synthetase A [Erysipelothrix larvae]|uniref:Aspartate--ammonia ligase n=1 Tax=Erysipelothrix larvae TaxID=1514105 RepID=A0A109UHI2_9FIRM|nr:aspartate--ammonia ligase [Erysipelothrix larvae]AMC94307.1 asparagine synthetase A [Erysipelothrix larvae]